MSAHHLGQHFEERRQQLLQEGRLLFFFREELDADVLAELGARYGVSKNRIWQYATKHKCMERRAETAADAAAWIAFVARGEVFAASAKDGGDAARVTRTIAAESEDGRFSIKPLLKLMSEKKASDLFFTSNSPVKIKIGLAAEDKDG